MANTMYVIGSHNEREWLCPDDAGQLLLVSSLHKAQFFDTYDEAEAHLVALKHEVESAEECDFESWGDAQKLDNFLMTALVYTVTYELTRTE